MEKWLVMAGATLDEAQGDENRLKILPFDESSNGSRKAQLLPFVLSRGLNLSQSLRLCMSKSEVRASA